MKIKPLSDNRCEARFWLFGHEFTKVFASKNEAYCFFEDLKSFYTAEVKSVQCCCDYYLETVSVKKSKGSCKWDRHIFSSLTSFLVSQQIHPQDPITTLKLSHLESYQNYLLDKKGLNPATVNRYFSTIKNFFKKCVQWEYLVKNPAKYLKSLPVQVRQRGMWTEDDFKIVYSMLNKQDKDMFVFLKLTGARISSAARVKVSDIDFAKKVIKFRTKKGPKAQEKIYQFPLHKALFTFLTKLITDKNMNDFLFLNSLGKPYNAKLFAGRVRKVLNRPYVKYNTTSDLNLHGLRHWLASDLHSKGLSLYEVKELLGHSTVAVTQNYLHSDTGTVLAKLDKIA